ncbi:MAG: SDR family oxidoreductase, partial [Ktedonobacterales bacterium]
FAKWRVRVNAICPGAISTNIDENTQRRDLNAVRTPAERPDGTIPLTGGQPGTAEDVAQVVLFLASDASGHVTGTEVFIDGAQSLLVG